MSPFADHVRIGDSRYILKIWFGDHLTIPFLSRGGGPAGWLEITMQDDTQLIVLSA